LIDKIVSEDVKRIVTEINDVFPEGKDILVTGGAGFIGSYLCDVLVVLGANVTCLDDFSTGLTVNVDHLFGKSNFHLVKEDVSNFDGARQYDYVLHFASRASPEEYQLHPIKTLLANSLGSYRMLELARKSDSKILFSSSSEVYGDSTVVPTPESYWGNVNPVGVRSCYDEGKRFSEALFMAYHREYGLATTILRIHNTYGPRLRADGGYGRALSRFVAQALRNDDLTVYGDGSQTRSFCYITDMTLGVLLALVRKDSVGEIINLGNPAEISIIDLAKKIRKVTRNKSKIVFYKLPEDDPKRRCPKVDKAEKIGWTPKVTLEEGLRRTVDWFRTSSW
jgi:UDP-glucuronate decarboxylase